MPVFGFKKFLMFDLNIRKSRTDYKYFNMMYCGKYRDGLYFIEFDNNLKSIQLHKFYKHQIKNVNKSTTQFKLDKKSRK